MDSAMYAIFSSLMAMMWLVVIAAILGIVATWRIYDKAGEPGWASLVPFFNTYTLFKITWGNGWYFLLLMIPFVNAIICIITMVKLAEVFGKPGGFALGLIFLGFIFMLVLAFDHSEYVGVPGYDDRRVPYDNRNQGYVRPNANPYSSAGPYSSANPYSGTNPYSGGASYGSPQQPVQAAPYAGAQVYAPQQPVQAVPYAGAQVYAPQQPVQAAPYAGAQVYAPQQPVQAAPYAGGQVYAPQQPVQAVPYAGGQVYAPQQPVQAVPYAGGQVYAPQQPQSTPYGGGQPYAPQYPVQGGVTEDDTMLLPQGSQYGVDPSYIDIQDYLSHR